MSMLNRAVNTMLSSLLANEGEEVTYSRGNLTILPKPSAVKAKGDLNVQDENGILIQYADRDFIFAAADLNLLGTVIEPLRGDRITTLDGDVHEVLAPDGFQPFRYSDSNKAMIRVHTKKR